MTDDEPLLDVRNLKKHYPITRGILNREVGRVRAVDGISFDVHEGETVGLVGESGCGKSTAATSILRLEEPTGGEVLFNGRDYAEVVEDPERDVHPNDVTQFTEKQLQAFRRDAQIIFQDPSSSFDPRMTIGESVAEPLQVHGLRDREARIRIVKDLLDRVGIPPEMFDRYPHEFSGGQKQRIALARALVLNPELIVADEPVSALDVSIKAEILSLINDIQEEFGLSILFISHDLSVIREVCDRVAVMYLGEIVELAPTEELFSDPQHPYTEALLSSVPTPDPTKRGMGIQLTGDVPSPSNPPSGCRFHTRCHRVIPPEGYDMEQANWRGVLDLREELLQGTVELDSLRELAVAEYDDVDEPEEVTDERLKGVIREEFDIPDRLTDTAAESVLSEALDEIVADDREAAHQRLESEFETVCATTAPELVQTESGHQASCHLLEEAASSEPQAAPSDD